MTKPESAARAPMSLVGELFEFFTLAQAERVASTAGSDEPSIRRLAQLARQRFRAAELLHRERHHAESLRMLDSAAEALVALSARSDALRALVGPLGDSSIIWDLDSAPLDDELSDAQHEQLAARFALVRAASARIAGVALDRAGRRDARWQRTGAVLCAALSVLAIGVREATTTRLTATSSASYDAAHGPALAVDGFHATNWVLPDHSPGWLEVSFARRRATAIELINAQGLVHYGTQDISLELYSGAQLVRSFDASMRATVGTATPTVIPLGTATPIDRIRIQVRTWHDLGGGLGEVRVR